MSRSELVKLSEDWSTPSRAKAAIRWKTYCIALMYQYHKRDWSCDNR